MKDMMPKKAALKDLIKAMKGLHMEKVKGYSKADDDIPSMVAKEAKKKKDHEEED